MKEEEIKEYIEYTKKLVIDQPEPFKTESFKIILSFLINSSNLIVPKNEKSNADLIPGKQDDKTQLASGTNSKKIFEELADEAKITLDQINDTISIKEQKIEILTSFQGKNKSEKMMKAISCILLISDKFFNTPWVKSEVITEYLRDLGIPDTGKNMSSYMKQNNNLYRFRGSGRFKEYKLTTEGRTNSLSILKELAIGS